MGNFKEKLLGLIDNGASTAMTLFGTMKDTIDSIDWDEQFNSLNEMKDSLLKKGNDLLGEFNELLKQVKNNITDFEVIVPFDESLGEKFECNVADGKLMIEVSFKDENTERSNKTTVSIPQNCDIEKMTHKYNDVAKTMTIIIPKVIAEPAEKKEEETDGYKLKKTAATPKKKVVEATEETHQAESKLLKKFRENTAKASGRVVMPRSANGRFVKRTIKVE
jgi:hypothetical protein